MEKFEKQAIFWVNGVRTEIQVRRYGDGMARLGLSGTCDGSTGQCQDSIASFAGEESRPLLDLLDIWSEHHLKYAPDSVFERAIELLDQLDGQRIGETPCVDGAPEIGGDIFYSLDAIARLEIYRAACVLLGIPESLVDTFDHGKNWPEEAPEDFSDNDSIIIDEYLALRAFCEAGADYADDWYYGCTVIAESHFIDYAQNLVIDCGDLPNEIPNYIAIDWEKTANNLKADYTELEYNGVSYLVR